MYYIFFFIYILSSISFSETYRFLLVFPYPFKSHCFLGESFVKLLLKAGHEVSYITPAAVTPHPNLSQIVIEPQDFKGIINLRTIEKPHKFKDFFDRALNLSYLAVKDANVQRLLEDTTENFDLVIAAWMFNDLYSGFSAVFDCPYIWFFTFHHDQEIMRLIHHTPNSLLTTNQVTNSVPPLNFLQRIQELLHIMNTKAMKYLRYDPLESKAYKELFGPVLLKRGRTLPRYEELRYNASLLLSNSQLAIRGSPIMPQNYKAIGGFHIFPSSEPLNQEFLSVIENSDEGVVLFSLGSFLKAEDMSNSIKRDLLAMFSKINYTILWKIDEQFKDLPPNVKTFSWIPIQRILAHPKCVLFVTHGGMLSLTESVHYGVPVVGIPVFADQNVNMQMLMKKGVARMVPMNSMLAENFKEALEDMLSNPGYKKNMTTLSSLYHDRPISPGAELVHWVEHVVCTRGAPHLRSSTLLVSWYQKYYFDLAAEILLLLNGFIFIVTKVIVCITDKLKVRLKRNVKPIENKKTL